MAHSYCTIGIPDFFLHMHQSVVPNRYEVDIDNHLHMTWNNLTRKPMRSIVARELKITLKIMF